MSSVKIISEDTTSCYFHNLSDSMTRKIGSWLSTLDTEIEILSIKNDFCNVQKEDSEENVVIMTSTIVYK